MRCGGGRMFLGVLGGNSPRRAGAGAVIRRRAVTRAWERHRIVSSAPLRCVLRSGASHSLQWGVMPAWRRRFRNDDGGDSFAVGLGAVAGACVDHGSGQARMPPQERRHEGFLFLRFVGGVVRFPEGCCRSGNAKQSFAGRIPKRSLGTTQV